MRRTRSRSPRLLRAGRWAALLGCLAALAATPSASASRDPLIGYNEDPDRLLAMAQAVERSNTRIARISFSWETIEPASDHFNWEPVDRVVALLRRAKIKPMITILGSAAWAPPGLPGIGCICERATDPDWHEMWQRVAVRYPRAVFSVWNEPNLTNAAGLGVERMAELTNEAARAIWAVSPDATVTGPPIAPVGDWPAYAGALYPKLRPRIEMAANLYPRGRLIANLHRDLGAVRRIADGRRIWITETNVSLSQVERQRQRHYVNAVYELAQRRRLQALIFHRLWSPFPLNGPWPLAWDAGLSALNLDGTPRALFGQIAKLDGG